MAWSTRQREEWLLRAYGRPAPCGAVERGIGAIFGFPNTHAGGAWFNKLGWTRLGAVPYLFKPLRSGYFLRSVSRAVDFPLSFPKRSRADIRPIHRFDEQVERLWHDLAGPETCGVERTAQYLNWRLIDCPSATYDCFGRFDGDRLRSMVATRTVDKHGGRLGYMMEALGDDTLPDLMQDSAARMKADGVDAILAWCPGTAPNRKYYRKAGFLPLPRRLGPEICFGAKALMPVAEPVTNPANWYLSYLDCDSV